MEIAENIKIDVITGKKGEKTGTPETPSAALPPPKRVQKANVLVRHRLDGHSGRHLKMISLNAKNQCSFIYPYPSVSELTGRNPDQVRAKLRPKLRPPHTVLTRERRKFRETQTMVQVSGRATPRTLSYIKYFGHSNSLR